MTTLQMSCAPRLLEELPRMFGGIESILKELFQNAFRCGTATLVEVEWDPDTHVLVFRDNGTGITDPKTLITAGDTGWDEQRVIDPAGLGVFSLLNDQICARVEIVSHSEDSHWKMILTPESLQTRAVQCEDMSPSKDTGLELTITLLPNIVVRKEAVAVARALYPYQVEWVFEKENPVGLLPVSYINSVIELDTEVGKLLWQPQGRGVASQQAVWEFCSIESTMLTKALYQAAGNHRHARLAITLCEGKFQWHVDPACKVRPRLPDRSELIDDGNLEKAAAVIVDALTNEVVRLFEGCSGSWSALIKPGMFKDELSESIGDNGWLFSSKFTKYLMELGGWKIVEADDPRNLVVYYIEDHGFDSLYENILYYDKNALEMSDRSAIYTLVNRGVSVAYNEKSATAVRLHGLKIGATVTRSNWEKKNGLTAMLISPFVLLVDRIEISDYGDVPFLIRENEYAWAPTAALRQVVPESDCSIIVFAGSASEFVAAIKDDQLLREAVALFAYNADLLEEWDWWLYQEGCIDHGAIEDLLVRQVSEAHAPNLFVESNNYFAHRDASQAVFAAIVQLKKATRHLRATKYMNVKVLLLLIAFLWRAASSLNAYLGKQRNKLGKKCGLL